MFNKLKSAMGDGPVRAAVENFSGKVSEKLKEISSLRPADVMDDARYKEYVIAPALLAAEASSSGMTRLIPDFENRFAIAMLYLRDELVIVDAANGTVGLVLDYEARVPDVLTEGFKRSVA
jgi:hypothetical protein